MSREVAMDRFNDLARQGFMKAAKRKSVTVFQVWLPNGEGMTHEGQNEFAARMIALKHNGTVKKAIRR